MKLLHAALLVAAADAARRRGAVSVTATEPPSPEDDAKTKQTVKAPKGPPINLGGTIETRLGDQLTVGGEYDQRDGQFRPRSLYATWNVPTKSRNPLVVRGTVGVQEPERRSFFASLIKVQSTTAPFTFLFGRAGSVLRHAAGRPGRPRGPPRSRPLRRAARAPRSSSSPAARGRGASLHIKGRVGRRASGRGRARAARAPALIIAARPPTPSTRRARRRGGHVLGPSTTPIDEGTAKTLTDDERHAERRRVEEVVAARRQQALAHQRHQQRRELDRQRDAERPERVAVGQTAEGRHPLTVRVKNLNRSIVAGEAPAQ